MNGEGERGGSRELGDFEDEVRRQKEVGRALGADGCLPAKYDHTNALLADQFARQLAAELSCSTNKMMYISITENRTYGTTDGI